MSAIYQNAESKDLKFSREKKETKRANETHYLYNLSLLWVKILFFFFNSIGRYFARLTAGK